MRKLVEQVAYLVESEKEDANKIHPLFTSMHEGASVIREELDETVREIECIESNHECLWDNIKVDDYDESWKWAKIVRDDAIMLAAEAIQLSAMCQKFVESIDKGDMKHE